MTNENSQQLQQQLVDYLRKSGALHDPAVAEAFLTVPRHLFLPDEPLERAYSDIAIMVKAGEQGQWTSSSSQPAMMAIMLEQLELRPGMRVLEIGAGSGFNAALMAALVGPEGQVTSLDIQHDLVERARERLEAAGWDAVEVITGDGGYGYPPNAPYDRIILTASSTVIPPAWPEQLVEGGRLVLPLNLGGPQVSVAFERRDGALVSVSSSGCGFMALQGAFTGPQPVVTPLNAEQTIFISAYYPPAVPTEVVSGWLDAPYPGDTRPSGVTTTTGQVLNNLTAWLNLHLPEMGMLQAEGELPDPARFPTCFHGGQGKEHQSRMTPILVDEQGAGLLLRRPGAPIPYWDWSQPDPGANEPAFELYVRAAGPGTTAAQRLLDAVRGWDQAGRPDSSRLKILALPADQPYHLAPGEMLIERPWTKFVVYYP